MIRVWLSFVPPTVTSQQKGLRVFGRKRHHFFTKDEVHDAETLIREALDPHRLGQPLHGAIGLHTSWVWPWRKNEPKRVTNKELLALRDTPPDHDNCVKLFQDVMTGMKFFDDDGRIAVADTNTYWGYEPGIGLMVGRLRDLNAAYTFKKLIGDNPFWFLKHWAVAEELK